MGVAVGSALGPYEVLAHIGRGGRADVYRARDRRIGRDVAVKVLPSWLTRDASLRRRFDEEARAEAALNHPNVVALYDVGVHGESPFVVSELLEGESLRERLRAGPLPLRRATDYAAQIARGLAAAHDKGIVHRDLRPENVFLTIDGQAKVLDFGLAGVFGSPGGPDPMAPRPQDGYLSPEQVRGHDADARCDVFALGALLFEMLTGRPAFAADSPDETLNAILKHDPPGFAALQARLPTGLSRILARCLEKAPGERFQSALDLAFALEGARDPSAGPAPAPAPRSRRFRGLVLALLGASGVAALLALGASSPPPVPSYRQLTFRRGFIGSARFAPDGHTIVYDAAWDGCPFELFSTRPEGPESSPLGVQAELRGISSRGEAAILSRLPGARAGTLARVPLGGRAPRLLVDDVTWADWAPDGEALAVVRMAGGRDRLEYPAGRVVHESAGWLSHPRVSPDGDQVAFLEHPVSGDNGGAVLLADRDGRVRVLSHGWKSLWGLAWHPTRREVWFTAGDAQGIRALHAVGGRGAARLLEQVPSRLTLHDVARDGRALLTNDAQRRTTLGRRPGDPMERDLSWLDYSDPRGLSADGSTLLFSEAGAGGGAASAVYVRQTDAAAAVRLGEGRALALSPDGRLALALLPSPEPRLVLYPVRAGEPRALERGRIERYRAASFFADGQRILLSANEAGRGTRAFVQELRGGPPRPVTPEGVAGATISPDGRHVAGASGAGLALYPVAGGAPTPLAALEPDEVPLAWSQDDRGLLLFRPGVLPARVQRLDLETRQRSLWQELKPHDAAGVLGVSRVLVARDGGVAAYAFTRILSELFLADGLD